MKQKNYKWVVYVVILAILAGVAYVATMDLTPAQQHIEKEVKTF